MTDTPYDDRVLLEAWLKEPVWLEPVDERRVAAVVHQTPQVKRWPSRPDHGRFTRMFDATRLVAASALLALVGGIYFASLPTTPAASPDPTATDATWVSGEVRYAPFCAGAPGDYEGAARRDRGYRCDPQTWTSDDPRLSGQATVTWNADVYETETGPISVTSMAWEIRGESGGWACAYPVGLERGTGLYTESVRDGDRIACAGFGDNEGMSAVLIADWSAVPRSFEGLILPGDLPPEPEL